ncbi:TrpB-like pyridoxal phosphate-dependent enzyme [Myxococcus sp. K15C18031901]|uniref:TrpB-like pyridoxal phosphate-dependent enzyme n=1 Tax=Myxococcus dinghuensis TaxID=2906761 RepID=UPI0020A80053|nr:TrpB-like pyridoxal phosphate-dependent enzyme [Myxococcus dinghuensis]MCP3097323.1 TrpB-like pyridoxal phosphate-dependent enzyme [Myxococcus dinghuensis]
MSKAQVTSVPKHWCNFLFDFPRYAEHDVPKAAALLESGARRVSVVPQQPLSLVTQSHSTREPYHEIPERLLELYSQYRPTPLRRARELERRLGANARIYYKYEGLNVSGSHKLNSALAQAYYYARAGIEELVTGTGAGQWGTALAHACRLFGLRCTVFMVGASLRQKPQRRAMMELFGATVHESPSDATEVGRKAAQRDPGRVGSLAIATGEALEVAHGGKRVRFAVGSGENCVLLHQTLIGSEAVEQMGALGEFPDHVVACMGAGSNFGGVGLPFLRAARERERSVRLLAVEPAACPKLTRGVYALDVNDFSGTTPINRMYTLGSHYIAPPIFAGGLRYHGTSAFLSAMLADKGFDAMAVPQREALSAGLLFAECEGLLPAPESAHAIAGALDLARRAPEEGPPRVILVNISGHGLFDLSAYERLRADTLEPDSPNEALLSESLRHVQEFNTRVAAAAR